MEKVRSLLGTSPAALSKKSVATVVLFLDFFPFAAQRFKEP